MAKTKELVKQLEEATEVLNKSEQVENIPVPNTVLLNQVAYAMVQVEGHFQAVKFSFNPETLTMGSIQVLTEGTGQFDVADELLLEIEEDIYR